jgi:hypothetical protein
MPYNGQQDGPCQPHDKVEGPSVLHAQLLARGLAQVYTTQVQRRHLHAVRLREGVMHGKRASVVSHSTIRNPNPHPKHPEKP